jgi:hypothetical protein
MVKGCRTVQMGFRLVKGRSSIIVGLAVAGALMTGCASDPPLADLGHMTERWIAAVPEQTTTTSTPVVAAPVGLLAAGEQRVVDWVNDPLTVVSPNPASSPEEVVGAVWSGSTRGDRYVQASRSTIGAALPGIEFPALIPQEVAYITSQLVFDPATGELASDAAAAFGLWSDKPYTKSRTVAQRAVLMVAVDEPPLDPVVPDTIGVPEAAPGDTQCDELTGSTVEDCGPVILEGGSPAWSLNVQDGWRLVWSANGYSYDLFVRNAAAVDLLADMAGSSEALIPAMAAMAGADGAEAEPAALETEESTAAAGS